MFREKIDVLHLPFTFFPDAPGGTEYYVATLIKALRQHGFGGAVAAPAKRDAEYEYEGIPVYRLAESGSPGLAQAYGKPDEGFALSFRALLERTRPDIVHLHAHTAAVSCRLADYAREFGSKVFFTYHTPSASCLRGTMIRMGRDPCDGMLNVRRCSVCALQNRGVPLWLGNLFAGVPPALGGAFLQAGLSGRAANALCMSHLMQDAHARFLKLMEGADRVVAVCQWVADVLTANGVPAAKLALCRQGLYATGTVSQRASRAGRRGEPLRLGYFGRIDPVKGVDVVIEAMHRSPAAVGTLDIYGICQPGSEAYLARLKQIADARIRFRPPLEQAAILDAMSECDFVVIPSRWLETGPLVAYEAFAAGIPVLGSRLGGIAELVRDGTDGVLITADDPASWAEELTSLAADRDRVQRLREGVRPPRTMQHAACEMAAMYRDVLTSGAPMGAADSMQLA